MEMSEVKKEIKDYVRDHYKYYGWYPMEAPLIQLWLARSFANIYSSTYSRGQCRT